MASSLRKQVSRYPAVVFILIFAGCYVVFLSTLAPTIYFLVDSAEYAIGAYSLGIVHSPGYPLYLSLAHVVSKLPIGDVAYRVNLISAFSLALAAAFLYAMLVLLIQSRRLAMATALTFVFSYYVWLTGVAAEVYAPQLATLTALGWALISLKLNPRRSKIFLTGALLGLAVAMHPSSALFAPGMVAFFIVLRVAWKWSIASAAVALLLFLVSLVYFPLRYSVAPAFNAAGFYNASGAFEAVNLRSVEGVWWFIRGGQFDDFFFAEGAIPSVQQVLEVVVFYWGNFLGIGVILGLAGVYQLYKQSKKWFWVWFIFFLPYTYFYTTYGAADRDTMFGPSYLLWSVVLAYGLRWLVTGFVPVLKNTTLVFLPLMLLSVNFSLVDASDVTEVHDRAVLMIEAMPQDAVVFGSWLDIISLQYLQIVENWRPDLRLYNLYYFPNEYFYMYLAALHQDGHESVIFLRPELDNPLRTDHVASSYNLVPLYAADHLIGYRLAAQTDAPYAYETMIP